MIWRRATPGIFLPADVQSPSLASGLAPLLAFGRQLRRSVRLLLVLSLILLGVQICLLALLLHPVSPASRILAALAPCWHRAVRQALGVRVTRAGKRPAPGTLLVCNHISWLDIVVIGSLLRVRFVSKDEVRRWPLIGLLASAAGTLFLRRGKPDGEASSHGITAAIRAALRNGEVVLVFPEGTTTTGEVVRRFHARLLQAGSDEQGHPQAPVQPLALAYRGRGAPAVPFVGDDDFARSLWRLLGERDVHAHLQFLPVLPPQPAREQAQAARQAVVAALGLAQR